MSSRTQHRQQTVSPVGAVIGRAVGTWVVTAVMFATFVDAEEAHAHPLTTGSWLLAVALSGLFVAAWVTRDFPHHGLRRLVQVWLIALVLVGLGLAAAAVLTDTERSRSADLDVVSALGTGALVSLGLALCAGVGLLVGRAVQASGATRR